MFFRKKKEPEKDLFVKKTPKFTHAELEKMDTEALKWLYINLHGEIAARCNFDDRRIYTDDMYGCETWGEARRLAAEVRDIYDRRTGKYVIKVKRNKAKNKVSYYYYGFKRHTITDMINGVGKDKHNHTSIS